MTSANSLAAASVGPTIASIAGLGFHVPDRVMTNAQFESMVETSDEWIVTRTGIRERRYVAPGEVTSDLAAKAATMALADAGLAASDLTHVLVATCTPDCVVPAMAYILAEKLDVKGVAAMDLGAACSGFVHGLETARAFAALHPEAVILLTGAEVMTSKTNFKDRNTCVLFGDGAGAVIVRGAKAPKSPLPGKGRDGKVLDVLLSCDGSLWSLLTVMGGGSASPLAPGQVVGEDYSVVMEGREVFKHAVRSMTEACKDILARNSLTVADVDLFVPHQANVRILDAVGKKLEMPESKVFVNLDKYGNTSAASVPIAMAEAAAQGRIRPGTLALLTAFGGGFTWGSALVRF